MEERDVSEHSKPTPKSYPRRDDLSGPSMRRTWTSPFFMSTEMARAGQDVFFHSTQTMSLGANPYLSRILFSIDNASSSSSAESGASMSDGRVGGSYGVKEEAGTGLPSSSSGEEGDSSDVLRVIVDEGVFVCFLISAFQDIIWAFFTTGHCSL